MADCWSCGAERGDAVFCGSCGVIQPLSKKLDDFAALGLPKKMALERRRIDKAFREASKKVHPDVFSKDTPEQRKLALAHTEKVNEAYRRLKDPRTRAEYLLALEGEDVASETERTEDPEFLMTMLERQEAVQFETDPEQLAETKADTVARVDGLLMICGQYFDEGQGDQGGVRAALVELRYLRRMLDQIKLKEEELF